jgi:hypothetical protein
MPFTTKEIVRQHVLEHHIGSSIVTGESVRLIGADSCPLANRPVLALSEAVKAREQSEPVCESVSFAQSEMASLTQSQLVPDSVVVASDSSLGRVFAEHVDYHVDYQQGTIRRLSSGTISPGATVTAWYIPYRIYLRGVDYDIDYPDGTIRRRSSGAIEAGQWVLVDYTVECGSINDAAIENAIAEAEEQILAFIDEAHRNSTDRALVAAATYLAVAIVCRIKAMEMMSGVGAVGSAGTNDSRSWIAVAEMYRKEAFGLMGRFAKEIGAFKAPEKA